MKKLFALFSACIIAAFSLNGISPASAKDLNLNGPGGRIHGADISRWQHPNGKPINFIKMHDAGVAFVMVKASDSRDDADQLAA